MTRTSTDTKGRRDQVESAPMRANPAEPGKTRAPRTRGKAADPAAGPAAGSATKTTDPGQPTKLDRILELLGRPGGASLDELCAVTGWQPHSVRGALAGALKRKGHVIVSDRIDGVRCYRIGAKS